MRIMNVDIETYSSVDIKAAGAYAYAEAPDFEILLIAYKIDGGPVEVIDLTRHRNADTWKKPEYRLENLRYMDSVLADALEGSWLR